MTTQAPTERFDQSTLIYNLYPNRLYIKNKADNQGYIDFSIVNGLKLNVQTRIPNGDSYTFVTGGAYIIDVLTWLNQVETAPETGEQDFCLQYTPPSYNNGPVKEITLALTRDANGIWSFVFVVTGIQPIKIAFQGIPKAYHTKNRNPLSPAELSAKHLAAWINLLKQQMHIIMSLNINEKKRELPARGQESSIG